ncbi:MAG TPA: STN domain-containing protein [Steroidobacteraceae bacterium]
MTLLADQSRADSAADTDPAAGASRGAVLSEGIPAESLSSALDDFARKSGLQLVYVSELAQHRSSQPISAGLSPPVALSRLLSGTGLTYEFLDYRTVRIFAPPVRKQLASESAAPAEQALNAALAKGARGGAEQ